MSWTAGALIFSGRPDPSWPLADARELWRRFEGLAPCDDAIPNEARLGYRGAWLRSPDGRRWRAFAHLAWRDGETKARRDEGRRLERSLLASAPPDVLPASALEDL